MSLPTRGFLRGFRAASLGVVGFVLALVAHVGAGGATPRPVVLFLLAGPITLAAVLLTRVRLSPVHVAVSLAAMQVVLHEAFMLGAQADCLVAASGVPASGHMGPGGRPSIECAAGLATHEMGQGSVFAAAAMVGAHIVATLVMAALLAYGEQVLWFLAGCVRAPRLLRVCLPELMAVRAVRSSAHHLLRVRFADGGVGRRGPPPLGLFAIV